MFPQLKGLMPANTPAELTIYGNKKDMYGENIIVYEGLVDCNISTKSKKQLGKNDTLVTYLTSTAFIFDDLELEDDIITQGKLIVNNHTYTIRQGMTQRDPFTGEFLFIKLELD